MTSSLAIRIPPVPPLADCEGKIELFNFINKIKNNYVLVFGFLHLVGKIFSIYPEVKNAFLRMRVTGNDEQKRISDNFISICILATENPSHQILRCYYTREVFKFILQLESRTLYDSEEYSVLMSKPPDGYARDGLNQFKSWIRQNEYSKSFEVVTISLNGPGLPDHTFHILRLCDSYYILQSYYYAYAVSSDYGFIQINSIDDFITMIYEYMLIVRHSSEIRHSAGHFMDPKVVRSQDNLNDLNARFESYTKIDSSRHISARQGDVVFVTKYTPKRSAPASSVPYICSKTICEISRFLITSLDPQTIDQVFNVEIRPIIYDAFQSDNISRLLSSPTPTGLPVGFATRRQLSAIGTSRPTGAIEFGFVDNLSLGQSVCRVAKDIFECNVDDVYSKCSSV